VLKSQNKLKFVYLMRINYLYKYLCKITKTQQNHGKIAAFGEKKSITIFTAIAKNHSFRDFVNFCYLYWTTFIPLWTFLS